VGYKACAEPFPAPIRAFDAIHLAAIVFIRGQGAIVRLASYDGRLVGLQGFLDPRVARGSVILFVAVYRKDEVYAEFDLPYLRQLVIVIVSRRSGEMRQQQQRAARSAIAAHLQGEARHSFRTNRQRDCFSRQ
jgi:hypothetical protein